MSIVLVLCGGGGVGTGWSRGGGGQSDMLKFKESAHKSIL